MTLNVAVLGATGQVGKEILSIIAERGLPATEVVDGVRATREPRGDTWFDAR